MRCIVKDCQNHEHQGRFIGSLCSPCHEYITKGEGRHSQAYRNAHRKPLTDEEIGRIAGDCLDAWSCARAIEAAHGIKE